MCTVLKHGVRFLSTGLGVWNLRVQLFGLLRLAVTAVANVDTVPCRERKFAMAALER